MRNSVFLSGAGSQVTTLNIDGSVAATYVGTNFPGTSQQVDVYTVQPRTSLNTWAGLNVDAAILNAMISDYQSSLTGGSSTVPQTLQSYLDSQSYVFNGSQDIGFFTNAAEHNRDGVISFENGTNADDNFFGGNLGDLIYGGAGRDFLYGKGGDDTIYGGDGVGVFGRDYVRGGEGNDLIYGGNETNPNGPIDGGGDIITGDAGNDTIFGGDGNDRANGDDGDDVMYLDAGADTLEAV
jgi:Ca2+-binding RTX toxin-like protein